MNRIKELRKEKGLTLDEVSTALDINRSTLNRYENENSEPKLETWKKLADYFGVEVGYLQGVSDIKISGWNQKIMDEYLSIDDKNLRKKFVEEREKAAFIKTHERQLEWVIDSIFSNGDLKKDNRDYIINKVSMLNVEDRAIMESGINNLFFNFELVGYLEKFEVKSFDREKFKKLASLRNQLYDVLMELVDDLKKD